MAVRDDIGDNSCSITITPVDTIDSILVQITNYLAFRNWIRISTNTVGLDTILTFSAPNINGGYKSIRITIRRENISGSSYSLLLGVSVLNATGRECGITSMRMNESSGKGSMQLLRSPTSNVRLYCFANIKWCYFITTDVQGGLINKVSVPPYSVITSYIYSSGWTSSHGDWSRLDQPLQVRLESMPVTLDGYTVSKNIGQWEGDPAAVPSVYDYWPTSSNRATPSNGGSINYERMSLMGCSELLDSPLDYPFIWADTAAIMRRHEENLSMVDVVHDRISMAGRMNGSRVYAAALNPQVGIVQPCGLIGDISEYRNLNQSNSGLLSGGKSLVQPLNFSARNYGFIGRAIGLFATEAKTRTDFLNPVWLKVDDNYQLDEANGVSRKFWSVPGFSRNYMGGNRHLMAGYNGEAYSLYYQLKDHLSGWSRSPIQTNWRSNVTEQSLCYCTFLIPA